MHPPSLPQSVRRARIATAVVVAVMVLVAEVAHGSRPAGAVEPPAPTTTTMSASATPSFVGQRLMLSADVRSPSGTPMGSVVFTEGSTVLGRATRFFDRFALNVRLPVGVHVVAATYEGSETFAVSSTSIVLTVLAGPTVVTATSSARPSLVGQRVTLAATVAATAPASGTPMGTVTFSEGATVLGTATRFFGRFAIQLSFTTSGTHVITAAYSGSESFTAGRVTFTHVVSPASDLLEVTPATTPASPAASPTLDVAMVTTRTPAPDASGSVLIAEGGTVLTTAFLGSGGRVTAALPVLPAGDHQLSVTYAGDAAFPPATTDVVQAVRIPTTMTVLSSPPVPLNGQGISFTAVVSPTPAGAVAGSVTFFDGTTTLGTASRNAGSTNAFVLSLPAGLGVGEHVIEAAYAGTGSHAESRAAVAVRVEPADTTTSLTVTPAPAKGDEPVVLRATVRATAPGGGVPNGTVTFTDGGTVVGTAGLWLGTYAIVLGRPALGDHPIVARFGGTATHRASSSAPSLLRVDPVLWLPEPFIDAYPNVSFPLPVPAFGGEGPRVAVVGDSITFNANVDHRFDTRALSAGLATSTAGLPGYQAATIKPYTDQYAALAPDVLIINLGTNDAAGQASGRVNFTEELFEQRLASIAAQFPDTCVVVTTITTHRTYTSPTAGYTAEAYDAAAQTYNDHLRTTYAHVADWDAIVGQHPDYVPDEVHMQDNLEGIDALIDLMIASAHDCLASPAPA